VDKLKDIFTIQNALKSANYYDISRISNEIYEYSRINSLSLEDILQRIKENEPWEYIRGYAEFRNENFKVNAFTLIPRIETETLVDLAKEEIRNSPTPYSDIVDVGTGSGCIAISLKKELSDTQSRFHATDTSAEALKVANENEVEILGSKTIDFIKTNLIEELSLVSGSNVLILANLPYIPTIQYLKLDSSVIDYEPRTALDGGSDGLKYYNELLAQIKTKKIIGCGIFEIEPSTLENFSSKPQKVFKDQYGKDRFVLIRFD